MARPAGAPRDMRNRYRQEHPPEFVAEVRSLWDDGLTMSMIGDALGVSKNVIAGLSYRNEFPERDRRHLAVSEDRVAQLSRQGLTITQIAARINRSYDGVRKALIRLGLHQPRQYR